MVFVVVLELFWGDRLSKVEGKCVENVVLGAGKRGRLRLLSCSQCFGHLSLKDLFCSLLFRTENASLLAMKFLLEIPRILLYISRRPHIFRDCLKTDQYTSGLNYMGVVLLTASFVFGRRGARRRSCYT